ncbi:hypothetical protein KJ966_13415 [bacterium]|nr:hypothetical protein [bacterium]
MKDLVIPTIECNVPLDENERPSKLVFVGNNHTCGGHEYCAGRRILENTCNALQDKKGYRGMDSHCVITMIKVQMDALNSLLGVKKGSRDKQRIRVEDVADILSVVREENQMCLSGGEPPLNGREAFNLITDLILEKSFVNKQLSNHFFGMMADAPEAKSFKNLDPKIIGKIKSTMSNSARLIFTDESSD